MVPFVVKTRFPTLQEAKRDLGLSTADAKEVDALVEQIRGSHRIAYRAAKRAASAKKVRSSGARVNAARVR